MILPTDGPGLYAAAQRSLNQSSQVSMNDGHALLCAVQAVAQALLALTAATVDSTLPPDPKSDTPTGAAWRKVVRPVG